MNVCDTCGNIEGTSACKYCDAKKGGKKYDSGKRRMDLVDYSLLDGVADVLTFGANQYGDNNWQKVETNRYQAALVRHISAYMQGDKVDKDSGIHHLYHAATNIMFLLWKEKEHERTSNKPTEKSIR